MTKLSQYLALAVAVVVGAAIAPADLAAQCARCAGGECTYGPFVEPRYSSCTFFLGSCYGQGACGDSFAAHDAVFSLDGLAIVADSEEESVPGEPPTPSPLSMPIAADGHLVLRHCSGMITAIVA